MSAISNLPNNTSLLSSSRWDILDPRNGRKEEIDQSAFNADPKLGYSTAGQFGLHKTKDGIYARTKLNLYHKTIGEEDGAYATLGAGVELSSKLHISPSGGKGSGQGVSGTTVNVGTQFMLPLFGKIDETRLYLKGNAGLSATQMFIDNDFSKGGTSVVNAEADTVGLHIDKIYTTPEMSEGSLAFLVYMNYRLHGDGMDAYNNLLGGNLCSDFSRWGEIRFTHSNVPSTKIRSTYAFTLFAKIGQIENDPLIRQKYGFVISNGEKLSFSGEFDPVGTPHNDPTITEKPPAIANLALNYQLYKSNSGTTEWNVGAGWNNLLNNEKMGGSFTLNGKFYIFGIPAEVNGTVVLSKDNEIAQAGPAQSSSQSTITKWVDPGDGGNVLIANYDAQSKEFVIGENSKMKLIVGTTNANGATGVVFTGKPAQVHVPVKVTAIQITDITDVDNTQLVQLNPGDIASVIGQEIPNMKVDGAGGLVLPIPLSSGSYNALNGGNKVMYNVQIDFETIKSDVEVYDPSGTLRHMDIKVIFKND
jgi:hypothetical protein